MGNSFVGPASPACVPANQFPCKHLAFPPLFHFLHTGPAHGPQAASCSIWTRFCQYGSSTSAGVWRMACNSHAADCPYSRALAIPTLLLHRSDSGPHARQPVVLGSTLCLLKMLSICAWGQRVAICQAASHPVSILCVTAHIFFSALDSDMQLGHRRSQRTSS